MIVTLKREEDCSAVCVVSYESYCPLLYYINLEKSLDIIVRVNNQAFQRLQLAL